MCNKEARNESEAAALAAGLCTCFASAFMTLGTVMEFVPIEIQPINGDLEDMLKADAEKQRKDVQRFL